MQQVASAVIYCRVSTKAQAEEGTSLESQERACRKLAQEKGFVVGKVFKEDWPGDTLDRPMLRQLRDQLKQGVYAALICHATDRLARKPVHLAIVAEDCDKAGAFLFFGTEPLDNSPEGQLIRYVKGYAAEIEREKIRERTMRGKQSRAAKGMLPQGTGKGIFGYRYHPDTGKRSVSDVEAEVVRQIYTHCIEGTSCHSIAVRLNQENIPTFLSNKWHPLTVKRILTNACYKGVTTFGQTKRLSLGGKKYKIVAADPKSWTEIHDVTPAIVSTETWQRAQAALATPRRHIEVQHRKYLLTSFVQCECGAPLIGSFLNKSTRYYRCRATWPTSVRPRSCDAPYVRADQLEEHVWKSITHILEHPDLVIEEVKRRQGETSVLDQEIVRLRTGLKRIADQERRLVRLFSLGEIDESLIQKETDSIKSQRTELEAELFKLEKQRLQIQSLTEVGAQVRGFCSKVAGKLDSLSFDDKRLALKALQIKTVVGLSGVKLFGLIPSFNATTERTSA
ncbi:MAG: Resolvase, N-terminal domain [Dehalococcoidia bacterium]|nr:Resolvase, N-terminal domain [Dehalococcoidia bacterium]